MQLRVRQIARNVLFNWLGTIANMAVGFFLAPFILHRLGDIAYGVWVLAVSVVGYLVLLDLGLRSSVLRFVSKGYTQGDHAAASDAISGALWIRRQIALIMLLASAAMAAVFPSFFKVSGALATDARWAVLLIGLNTAITMCVGVFGGVLSGLNRYDLQNYISFVQTAIRITGVVIVLRTGHGIVAIALCELVATVVGNVLLVIVARRLYPQLQVHFRRPEREVLRKLWSYSIYAFINTIALQLVYQSDNLVVGAFISAGAVTYYAIANSLCRYVGQLITSITTPFAPAASTYEAAGDNASLLKLYIHGTRTTLAVCLPVLITFVVRGRSFITLWMGSQYAPISGTVLLILSIPLFFVFANRTAEAIAYGVEKHQMLAVWAVGEGVTNLVLSIILVRHYGIYGVAIGTLIPSMISQLGFWPWYAARLVGISRFHVLWRVWLPMFVAAVPFAIVSYALDRSMPAQHLITFALQLGASLLVFCAALAITFRVYVRQELVPRLQLLFRPA